ncbi:MAG: hypothetical protein RL011_1711 [Pseudomonadota bacterium]
MSNDTRKFPLFEAVYAIVLVLERLRINFPKCLKYFLGEKLSMQSLGVHLNKAAIAKQVGIDPTTVANYFEIPEDTLIGFTLPAFSRSVRKAQRQLPKFHWLS